MIIEIEKWDAGRVQERHAGASVRSTVPRRSEDKRGVRADEDVWVIVGSFEVVGFISSVRTDHSLQIPLLCDSEVEGASCPLSASSVCSLPSKLPTPSTDQEVDISALEEASKCHSLVFSRGP